MHERDGKDGEAGEEKGVFEISKWAHNPEVAAENAIKALRAHLRQFKLRPGA